MVKVRNSASCRRLLLNYSILEKHIINLFKIEDEYFFKEKLYKVKIVGKPRPNQGGGECKTDIYVLGENDVGEENELKISVKSKLTNEFQANKLTPKIAEDLFGLEWSNIITQATRTISERFENTPLIYIDKKGNTHSNSVTMGWKLEIASKPRALSVPLPLSSSEIKNVIYKGINSEDKKRNAVVNGDIIFNSGIAEYISYCSFEDLTNTTDVIESLIPIDQMNIEENCTYLIFTANNWRTEVDKTDGKRYLAVSVKWSLKDGKLIPEYIYDNPLSTTGFANKTHLIELFNLLEINHPNQLNIYTQIDKKSIIFKK